MTVSAFDPDQAIPVLYSFRLCPYAMRARLAIAGARMTVELREVESGSEPEAMLWALRHPPNQLIAGGHFDKVMTKFRPWKRNDTVLFFWGATGPA